MSELLGLGESDADARWIGIRRHQVALAIAGVGLAGDGVVRRHGSWIEVAVGAVFVALALPISEGCTGVEWAIVGVGFLCRSRWFAVSVGADGPAVSLRAGGSAVAVRGYRLAHRGRLDLSGLDVEGARSLASFADALATGSTSCHVSLHVRSWRDAATLLTVPIGVTPPSGWVSADGLVRSVVGLERSDRRSLLEQWGHLRAIDGVVRVLRVCDFTGVPIGHAALQRIQSAPGNPVVSVQFDVIAGPKARRLVERAVHRFRSDGATTAAAGFRRRARVERELERLNQREALVANGRSLLHVAVYVLVRSGDCEELRRRCGEVVRAAHESGLRCHRGWGRQALWYRHQLPGGPGW